MQKYKCLSKPTASHMTWWSTWMAQSQGTGLVGGSQSNRVRGSTVHKDRGAHRVTISSLTMEVEVVIHTIQWLASQQTHRLHMLSFSQTQWTSCKRWSLEWATQTGTQPCTVFGYKDLWGSSVLGHARVSGDEQADRLASTADITSALQLGRAEVLRGLGNFLNMDRQGHHSIIAWRKEEWRKEAADIPPLRTICVQLDKYWHCFDGNLGETAERWDRACMGLSERYDAILNWNWNRKLKLSNLCVF